MSKFIPNGMKFWSSGLASHTATARNHLARDIATESTGQEQGHTRNVIGRARPAQRNALYEARLNLVAQHRCHIGLDKARGNAVGPHAPRAQLFGNALGQRNEARL